ncbi:MAG: D-alanyl-D-alanine dipeptidase [Gammaproteobacteria bacterium]
MWVIGLIVLPSAVCPLERASEDELALVNVAALIPGVLLDIRYATDNNFTKHVLYSHARCYLRAPVARKLAEAQAALGKQGLRLKIFDCYRPLSVQKKLWRLVPDERYVADPKKSSRHNRGAAVDVSLVDASGREVPMPTGYDDFTERAHRDYMRLPVAAIKNRALLETIMQQHGFEGLPTEWWHFDFRGWQRFPISDRSID